MGTGSSRQKQAETGAEEYVGTWDSGRGYDPRPIQLFKEGEYASAALTLSADKTYRRTERREFEDFPGKKYAQMCVTERESEGTWRVAGIHAEGVVELYETRWRESYHTASPDWATGPYHESRPMISDWKEPTATGEHAIDLLGTYNRHAVPPGEPCNPPPPGQDPSLLRPASGSSGAADDGKMASAGTSLFQRALSSSPEHDDIKVARVESALANAFDLLVAVSEGAGYRSKSLDELRRLRALRTGAEQEASEDMPADDEEDFETPMFRNCFKDSDDDY